MAAGAAGAGWRDLGGEEYYRQRWRPSNAKRRREVHRRQGRHADRREPDAAGVLREGQGRPPPRIVGDFNGWAVTPQGYDVSIGKPTRIDGTSWSYLESTSYTNARLEYVFFFDKESTADPLNPRTVQAYAGPRSEVRMPFWVAQPEVDEAGVGAQGRGDRRDVDSRSLGGQRRVWFYLPPGYAAATDTLFPVIYVLDGSNYVEKMDVPRCSTT